MELCKHLVLQAISGGEQCCQLGPTIQAGTISAEVILHNAGNHNRHCLQWFVIKLSQKQEES